MMHAFFVISLIALALMAGVVQLSVMAELEPISNSNSSLSFNCSHWEMSSPSREFSIQQANLISPLTYSTNNVQYPSTTYISYSSGSGNPSSNSPFAAINTCTGLTEWNSTSAITSTYTSDQYGNIFTIYYNNSITSTHSYLNAYSYQDGSLLWSIDMQSSIKQGYSLLYTYDFNLIFFGERIDLQTGGSLDGGPILISYSLLNGNDQNWNVTKLTKCDSQSQIITLFQPAYNTTVNRTNAQSDMYIWATCDESLYSISSNGSVTMTFSPRSFLSDSGLTQHEGEIQGYFAIQDVDENGTIYFYDEQVNSAAIYIVYSNGTLSNTQINSSLPHTGVYDFQLYFDVENVIYEFNHTNSTDNIIKQFSPISGTDLSQFNITLPPLNITSSPAHSLFGIVSVSMKDIENSHEYSWIERRSIEDLNARVWRSNVTFVGNVYPPLFINERIWIAGTVYSNTSNTNGVPRTCDNTYVYEMSLDGEIVSSYHGADSFLFATDSNYNGNCQCLVIGVGADNTIALECDSAEIVVIPYHDVGWLKTTNNSSLSSPTPTPTPTPTPINPTATAPTAAGGSM